MATIRTFGSSLVLNIDNPYFEQVVGQIYPTDRLQLNKATSFDTEAPFLTWTCPYRKALFFYLKIIINGMILIFN